MRRLAVLEVLPCILLILSQLSAENLAPAGALTPTEHLNLTSAHCTNTSTFQHIQGTFQAYNVYIDVDEGMDEFKPIVVTCGLNGAVVPNECKDLVWGSIPNISIQVNGTIPESSFRQHYRPHIKQFGTAMYFEEHERGEFTCSTTLEGGGVLMSNTRTLEGIDELHAYKIIPESVDVRVGSEFKLTCITDNVRGLGVLSWSLWDEIDGYETEVECSGSDPHQFSLCSIENKPAGVPPHSILTVSTEKTEYSNVTVEYTYRCNGMVNHTHQHKMLGEAHVMVHPVKDNRAQIGIGVAGGIVVIGALILAAVIIFRRSQLTTVMSYNKLDEPEHVTYERMEEEPDI